MSPPPGTRVAPGWQPPMLATLVDASSWIPAHPTGWVYERKLDGLRCIGVRRGGEVELWSRNHNSFLARFPAVAAGLAGLPTDSITVDGELVAWDGRDYVGFGRLQQHGSELSVIFAVFDVLDADGHDLRAAHLAARKDVLASVLGSAAGLALVDELHGDPADLLAEACAQGWEGLVAKRAAAPYTGGRSADWCKLKCTASQELVIGGWTDPRGARAHLGALLMGYYEGDRLRYAGKVGTGFTAATLAGLAAALAPLERSSSPFADPVRERGAHWVEPRLVANVAFAEWTRDGRLRHPRFEGLRPDKAAGSVIRERPEG